MIELSQWAATSPLPAKPWLILGKGPTFAHRSRFDLDQYNLFALNHVVREVPVDIAHAIDLEVVLDCSDVLPTNCRWLIMPRRPHVRLTPGNKRLDDYVQEIPVLRELHRAGRLVWYNASSAGEPLGEGTMIDVRWFSAEAAVKVLALLGARTIRTLGVDGGTRYSGDFDDLARSTRIAAGHVGFDLQFAEIDKTVAEYAIDYKPLIEPVRVFVGTDESQLIATRVLEYSIRKYASRTVQFNVMKDLPVPTPEDPRNRPRTGFSFYRFMIPQLCGFNGKALYLDADMQVFDDIAKLWDLPLGRHKVLCTYFEETPTAWIEEAHFKPGRQMSVLLMDCSRLDWDIRRIVEHLDQGSLSYEDLMFDLAVVQPDEIGDVIPSVWNSLETYEPGTTKLIHYTVADMQPWKNDRNPLRELWMKEYRAAVAAGAIDVGTVRTSILRGHVKPSLAEPFLSPSSGLPLRSRWLLRAAAVIARLRARIPILFPR